MKVLLVCSLPFHRWIMGPLAMELWRRGREVRWFVHRPRGPQDWLYRSRESMRWLSNLGRSWGATMVVAADYPYVPLRELVGAPVVGVRHSLASRRNTWEQKQAGADWLVTWSAWDDDEFLSRGVSPRRWTMRAGCVWVDPLLAPAPEPKPGAPVLWAPSLNPDLACRSRVTEELTDLAASGRPVVVRPHAATLWREQGWVRSLRKRGLRVVAPSEMEGPWLALESCALLVTDVSGIGLLAAHAQGGRLPVVQVDPLVRAHHEQFDPRGPEWLFRDALGPRVPLGEDLARVVREALDHAQAGGDPHTETRRAVARHMVMEGEACPRLAEMLEQAVES